MAMIKTFRVGSCTIHRIVESEGSYAPALAFLPNLSSEVLANNRHWLRPFALDENDNVILCFQSYVVQTPRQTILIDTCVGNNKDRPAQPAWHRMKSQTYLQNLADVGLRVEDIDVVLCTHLHIDHVGWNTRLENGRWVPTFPKARYLFSKRELDDLQTGSAGSSFPHFVDSVLPIVAAGRADLVASDHVVSDYCVLLPTPGHSLDHFAVAFGKKGADVIITGDLIHSPIQARYPDVAMRADLDRQQAAKTRRTFLERFSESATFCCFSHFPSPSVARIKRWDDGFRCDYIASDA